jgi:nitroreductase
MRDIPGVLRWSGSASNRQDWVAVLVRDRESLKRLAAVEGYAGHLAGAAAGFVLMMAGERPEQDAFDEGRLAERIMLSAEAHGVASCIGWFRDAGRDEAKRILGVPPDRMVRTAVSLGYPAEGARRGGRRKPLQDFVREERFP